MNTDKMILGENVVFSTNSDETGLNNNVIICGSSGCGKTMSISEPCLLETYNSSVVATVTKRRIVNKYKKVFEERGYTVEDLNFINPKESNVAYDPLYYVKSYSDIKFLADAVVKANPKKEKATNVDPYWDESASSLLCAEISYILMTKDNPTFADVLAFHDKIDLKEDGGQIVTAVDNKFDMLAQKEPSCYAVSCWKTFHNLPIKTASCVYSTLNTTIDTIFSPQLRNMIANNKKVDFEKIATQKTALFISTSAVNPSLHCFINMFYAQMFKQLFEFAESQPDGVLPVPVNVLCDDFATGSRILNFPEYISIFREKRISVKLLIQSESQLEGMYGQENATTIINNCDTYIYMGGMDLRTGRSISERLNAPLEDVLYMPIGQEFVFRRGQKPIITKRYDILKDESYQKITKEYENYVKSKKEELDK